MESLLGVGLNNWIIIRIPPIDLHIGMFTSDSGFQQMFNIEKNKMLKIIAEDYSLVVLPFYTRTTPSTLCTCISRRPPHSWASRYGLPPIHARCRGARRRGYVMPLKDAERHARGRPARWRMPQGKKTKSMQRRYCFKHMYISYLFLSYAPFLQDNLRSVTRSDRIGWRFSKRWFDHEWTRCGFAQCMRWSAIHAVHEDTTITWFLIH